MKNIKTLLIFCLCLCFIVWADKKANAAGEAEYFPQKLEEYLRKAEFYYHKNSLKVMDTLELDGVVDKIVQVDDPATPENEEKTETYNAKIMVGYGEFREQRDTIFFFGKKDVFFYDVDNDIFLTFGEVAGNEEVSSFFDQYKDDLKSKLLTSSLVKMLLLLFVTVILWPLFIILYWRRSNSKDSTALFLEGSKKVHFK
ncbi:hypothetical protein ACOJQI_19670 [Bacillus salacetis]|uniref:hypothetical protein n=1 Tax=Bacillus salacetis TaxID=2315464 RepID=UPI003B9E8D6A